jgi:hypothetical protein
VLQAQAAEEEHADARDPDESPASSEVAAQDSRDAEGEKEVRQAATELRGSS